MKIKIPNYKYKVSSNLGITSLEEDDIVKKLNSIIDWDECTFPPNLEANPEVKEVEVQEEGETRGVYEILCQVSQKMSPDEIDSTIIPELERLSGEKITRTDDGKWWKMKAKVFPENKDYLGNPPSLKPGNCFIYEGQIIAVDKSPETGKERLVLYSTETGIGFLERFKKEVIEPEFKLRNRNPEAIFELNIIDSKMIPFEKCKILQPGDTKFEDVFSENQAGDDLLENPFVFKKLNPTIWRYLLKSFPVLKEQLQDNILELRCEPNFEEIKFYIDRKGGLVYDWVDLAEEEYEMIFPCFWNGLWEYLRTLFKN